MLNLITTIVPIALIGKSKHTRLTPVERGYVLGKIFNVNSGMHLMPNAHTSFKST